MPRTHQRKTEPASVTYLRARDIPAWASAVAPGDPPLFQVLNAIRYDATGLQKYRSRVDALVSEARSRSRSTPFVLLELLDLVPLLLDEIEKYGWMKDELRRLFTMRAYVAFDPLRRRVGKIGGRANEQRASAVAALQFHGVPLRDESTSEIVGVRSAHRMSREKAREVVAEFDRTGVDTVVQSEKRYARNVPALVKSHRARTGKKHAKSPDEATEGASPATRKHRSRS